MLRETESNLSFPSQAGNNIFFFIRSLLPFGPYALCPCQLSDEAGRIGKAARMRSFAAGIGDLLNRSLYPEPRGCETPGQCSAAVLCDTFFRRKCLLGFGASKRPQEVMMLTKLGYSESPAKIMKNGKHHPIINSATGKYYLYNLPYPLFSKEGYQLEAILATSDYCHRQL